MRPSSRWRKESDETVDIFGNKKRGGGGDPIRTNAGSIVSNLSSYNKYKILQQNINKDPHPTAITKNTLLSSDDIPPHLKSSMDQSLTSKDDKLKDLSNKLFRQQLDEQIAAQKKRKMLEKMKEIEQEKLEQQKLEKELQVLRNKHIDEINNEPNVGFLNFRGHAFKNSLSHIPPKSNPQKSAESKSISSNPPFEEIKETETDIDEQALNNLREQANQLKLKFTENDTKYRSEIERVKNEMNPQHLKALEMHFMEEKMLWKQKISEQELELKKLKLQMLEQQNDQKTTLQYLLKLQTDFTQQIYTANQQNNVNLRRPLSAFTNTRPTTVQSSIPNHPVNITKAPSIPQTPPSPPPSQQPVPSAYAQYITPAIVNDRYPGITQPNHEQVVFRKPSMRNANIINPDNHKNQIHSIQQSSYFPVQSNKCDNRKISHPSKQIHHTVPIIQQTPELELNVSLPIQSKPEQRHLTQTSNQTSRQMSPTEFIGEQKQESFLICSDDENDAEKLAEHKPLGMLLRNESSFLQFSDVEQSGQEQELELDLNQNEKDGNDTENTQLLSSCTRFELSSRPTTAIPTSVMAAYRNKPQQPQQTNLSPTPRSNHSSYSSFDGNMEFYGDHEQKQPDDPFTIHVVVDDKVSKSMEENQWRQISEMDRNNVASLRDAFEELSKEDFPVTTVMDTDGSSNDDDDDDAEVEVVESIDTKIPIASPKASMSTEAFVVKYMQSKEEYQQQHGNEPEDGEQEETEYEEDFEIESEPQQLNGARNREVLRLPDLDASINNFASKVYSVYSSFDESLMTNSVASSSDLSNKSPDKRNICKTIRE